MSKSKKTKMVKISAHDKQLFEDLKGALEALEVHKILQDKIDFGTSFGVDVGDRTIKLIGPIEESMLRRFRTALEVLDSYEGNITVQLCSCGGCLLTSFAIYDLIVGAKNEVVTEGFGLVMSGASLVLQGGTYRTLLPYTQVMIHDCAVSFGGSMNYKAFQNNAAATAKWFHFYLEILSQRSGQSINEIKKLCQKETYFTPEEAVKLGLADKVIVRPGV